jgi:hypothetical protein
MDNEIQIKRCFLGINCIEKQCPAWTTFTDTEQGVCAFRIGSTAVKMIPGMINEISGVLKKLSLLVFLFLVFAQPVLCQDTWENNKKYIAEKLDNLTFEVKALRQELKTHTGDTAKQEAVIYAQNVKIEGVEMVSKDMKAEMKYLYGLLVLSIGGNAVSGGVLLKNRRNGKQQPTTTNN